MTEQFKQFYNWSKTFDRHIQDFDRKDPFFAEFKPYRENRHIDDGLYVTIRCGLGGIYTMLNEIKCGVWQGRVLDDSRTIAYRPLTQGERETYENHLAAMKAAREEKQQG